MWTRQKRPFGLDLHTLEVRVAVTWKNRELKDKAFFDCTIKIETQLLLACSPGKYQKIKIFEKKHPSVLLV